MVIGATIAELKQGGLALRPASTEEIGGKPWNRRKQASQGSLTWTQLAWIDL